MNRDEFFNVYWKCYRLLERDLVQTDDYVSIDKDNYNTFSNQYLKLFITICSEIDSIAETLCREINNNNKPPYGIKNKLVMLINEDSNLINYKVHTKYPYNIKNITPMIKFSEDSMSDWWNAYNDIKHRRYETNDAGRYNYTKANLKNVLYAMAALYILNCTLYERLKDSDENDFNPLDSILFDDRVL